MFPLLNMRIAKRGAAICMSLCLIWTSGNLAQAALETAPLLTKPLQLPQLELMPPGQFGRVADYFNAPASGAKLVILIQDLHAHYGVQKNIAGILDFLTTKLSEPQQQGVPFALAVEGAEGPIDSSVMALFPDQKIKQQALDYLMREGELTGMEYFAAMRGIPNLLVGVEDGRYYEAHRELFRKTYESRAELVNMLRGIQADIGQLSQTVYSPSLAAVHAKVQAYDKAELSTMEFIKYLVDQTNPNDLRDYPALKAFVQNSATDANQADALRRLTAEFLTQVADRLSKEERATLAALAKREGTGAYYAYLRDLIYQHQLFMTVPVELAKYLEYRHTAQTMEFDRVTHEARELAFHVKMRAAQSRPEKDLVQVEHDLACLLKVADLQATEFEVRAFGPRLNEFVALCHALLVSHGLKSMDETKVRELVSTSIDFYAMALMRNKPMVENTLRLMGPSGNRPNTAVLVTGGFHTSILTQLLRDKNISYLVITPTVENLTEADHELYIKRLNGEMLSPSELLAAGQQMAPQTWVARLLRDPSHALQTGFFGGLPAKAFLYVALGLFAAGQGKTADRALPAFQKQARAVPQANITEWSKEAIQVVAQNQRPKAIERQTTATLQFPVGMDREAQRAFLESKVRDFYRAHGLDIGGLTIRILDSPFGCARTYTEFDPRTGGIVSQTLEVNLGFFSVPGKPGVPLSQFEETLTHEYFHFHYVLPLKKRKEEIASRIYQAFRAAHPEMEAATFEEDWRTRVAPKVFAALNTREDADAERYGYAYSQRLHPAIEAETTRWHEFIMTLSTDETAQQLSPLSSGEQTLVYSVLSQYGSSGLGPIPEIVLPSVQAPATSQPKASNSAEVSDITIAAEGEGAATHDEVNKWIIDHRDRRLNPEFRIERLPLSQQIQAAWRIARVGEWRLALNALRYTVYLYGGDDQKALIEGVDADGRPYRQTTHAGISTGAIHLARGEYLRLVQAERDKPGHYYLAGRIAHETKEIVSWRHQARNLGISWRTKDGQDRSPMRQRIQDNIAEAITLDTSFHGQALELERTIATDPSIGQKEVPLDTLFENETMVKTILHALAGDPAHQITLKDILQWVQRLTFEELINLPPSAGLPNSSQQIYIVVVGEQRYAVLLNREQTQFGVSVSGAIAPTKRGKFPSVFYQMPSSMAHAIHQEIESRGNSLRPQQIPIGLKLWPGWIRSDYERLVFQESLELHPAIKRFILYWLQKGMRPVVGGVWELFNPDDPSRQVKDEAGASFVPASNSIIRNAGLLNAGDVSPFVHEYIHAVYDRLNATKRQKIEQYFRKNHPEFINLFRDISTYISIYQGAESYVYSTEALAFYLQMALTGFWGLELSKKTKLVLTNEDLDFFEQQGFIDATIKAMILKQARHKWMKPYDRFWNMPEESRAILFSPGANAKRIAARRALLDKDPFDLSTYAPKPAPVRIDINISSEGPAAPDDNDDSYKLPAAFRSYRVTPRMAPLLRQALPELESYLQALTAHWKELLEVLEAGGDVQLWVGKSEEILRQHPWAAFEQAHPELTAQPEFRLLREPVIDMCAKLHFQLGVVTELIRGEPGNPLPQSITPTIVGEHILLVQAVLRLFRKAAAGQSQPGPKPSLWGYVSRSWDLVQNSNVVQDQHTGLKMITFASEEGKREREEKRLNLDSDPLLKHGRLRDVQRDINAEFDQLLRQTGIAPQGSSHAYFFLTDPVERVWFLGLLEAAGSNALKFTQIVSDIGSGHIRMATEQETGWSRFSPTLCWQDQSSPDDDSALAKKIGMSLYSLEDSLEDVIPLLIALAAKTPQEQARIESTINELTDRLHRANTLSLMNQFPNARAFYLYRGEPSRNHPDNEYEIVDPTYFAANEDLANDHAQQEPGESGRVVQILVPLEAVTEMRVPNPHMAEMIVEPGNYPLIPEGPTVIGKKSTQDGPPASILFLKALVDGKSDNKSFREALDLGKKGRRWEMAGGVGLGALSILSAIGVLPGALLLPALVFLGALGFVGYHWHLLKQIKPASGPSPPSLGSKLEQGIVLLLYALPGLSLAITRLLNGNIPIESLVLASAALLIAPLAHYLFDRQIFNALEERLSGTTAAGTESIKGLPYTARATLPASATPMDARPVRPRIEASTLETRHEVTYGPDKVGPPLFVIKLGSNWITSAWVFGENLLCSLMRLAGIPTGKMVQRVNARREQALMSMFDESTAVLESRFGSAERLIVWLRDLKEPMDSEIGTLQAVLQSGRPLWQLEAIDTIARLNWTSLMAEVEQLGNTTDRVDVRERAQAALRSLTEKAEKRTTVPDAVQPGVQTGQDGGGAIAPGPKVVGKARRWFTFLGIGLTLSLASVWGVSELVKPALLRHDAEHLRQVLIMKAGDNFSPADAKFLFKFFRNTPPNLWGERLLSLTAGPQDSPLTANSFEEDIIKGLLQTAINQKDEDLARRSLETLASLLDDPNDSTRVHAAEALDKLTADLPLLGDQRREVERRVAEMLDSQERQSISNASSTERPGNASAKTVASIQNNLATLPYLTEVERKVLATEIGRSVPHGVSGSELKKLKDLAVRLRSTYRIHQEGHADLGDAVQTRRANCIGSTQLLAAAASAINLQVQPIEVIHNFAYHVMSLVKLGDGRYVFIDLLQPNRFVGNPFDLERSYVQEGAFWKARAAVPEGAPNQFRMLDPRGIAAYVAMEKPYLNGSLLLRQRAYEAATNLDPSNPWAWVQLGETYLEIEHQRGDTSRAEYSQAGRAFQRALEIAPDFLPAMEVSWVVDRNQGNFGDALRRLDRVVALLEAHIPADLFHAGTVYEGGDPRAGEERTVLAGLYQERAQLLDDLGRHAQAATDRRKRADLAGKGWSTPRFDNLVNRERAASAARMASEDAFELARENHWLGALGLMWGMLSWFVHRKILRQPQRPVRDELRQAIVAALEEEGVMGVSVEAGEPGTDMPLLAGAHVLWDEANGIKKVVINTYAPFGANVRGAIHETEHLKNPGKIGDAKEEARIIRKSYDMMRRLNEMIKEHNQRVMQGVQNSVQREREALTPRVEDVKDALLDRLFPIWHLHREQSLLTKTRTLILTNA